MISNHCQAPGARDPWRQTLVSVTCSTVEIGSGEEKYFRCQAFVALTNELPLSFKLQLVLLYSQQQDTFLPAETGIG